MFHSEHKPVVHYHPTTVDVIKVGSRAYLYGGVEDHPRINDGGGMVHTSKVLFINGHNFETENTKYSAIL